MTALRRRPFCPAVQGRPHHSGATRQATGATPRERRRASFYRDDLRYGRAITEIADRMRADAVIAATELTTLG